MSNNQGDADNIFTAMSVDDKLAALYKLIRGEADNNNKRHQELRSDFRRMKKKIEKLEHRVSEHDTQHDNMQDEITVIHNSVTELQQAALACDIVIKGIPEQEDNDTELVELIQAVFKTLQCDDMLNDCASAVRLGKKSSDTKKAAKPRPILLQMKTKNSKQKLMETKKKAKLACSDVVFKGNPVGKETENIYFDERLTAEMSELFYEARQLKRNGVCSQVWVRNGTVFARKTDTSAAKKICGTIHLEELQNQPVQRTKKRGRQDSPDSKSEADSFSETTDSDCESDTETATTTTTRAAKKLAATVASTAGANQRQTRNKQKNNKKAKK